MGMGTDEEEENVPGEDNEEEDQGDEEEEKDPRDDPNHDDVEESENEDLHDELIEEEEQEEEEIEDQSGDDQQEETTDPDDEPQDLDLGHPDIPVDDGTDDPALTGTDDDGAPIGLIVGVSAGVAVLLLGAIVLYVIRKRKQRGTGRLFTELDGINASAYNGDVVSDDGSRLGPGGSYQRDASIPTSDF